MYFAINNVQRLICHKTKPNLISFLAHNLVLNINPLKQNSYSEYFKAHQANHFALRIY